MKRNRKSVKETNATLITLLLLSAMVMAGCGSVGDPSPFETEDPMTAYSSGDEGGRAEDGTIPAERDADPAGDNTAAAGKESDRPEDKEASQNSADNQAPGPDGQTMPSGFDDIPQQSATELPCSIKTVGTDSLIVSRHFVMSSQEADGADIQVAPAEGSSDEVLVTVYITEDTIYEIHTVHNGGVNGDADVDVTAGSFSDLVPGCNVDFQGHFEEDAFHADRAIIYRFV